MIQAAQPRHIHWLKPPRQHSSIRQSSVRLSRSQNSLSMPGFGRKPMHGSCSHFMSGRFQQWFQFDRKHAATYPHAKPHTPPIIAPIANRPDGSRRMMTPLPTYAYRLTPPSIPAESVRAQTLSHSTHTAVSQPQPLAGTLRTIHRSRFKSRTSSPVASGTNRWKSTI